MIVLPRSEIGIIAIPVRFPNSNQLINQNFQKKMDVCFFAQLLSDAVFFWFSPTKIRVFSLARRPLQIRSWGVHRSGRPRRVGATRVGSRILRFGRCGNHPKISMEMSVLLMGTNGYCFLTPKKANSQIVAGILESEKIPRDFSVKNWWLFEPSLGTFGVDDFPCTVWWDTVGWFRDPKQPNYRLDVFENPVNNGITYHLNWYQQYVGFL